MMAHIPYGYRIEDGRAVIDEMQAANVRKLFEGYISGQSLKVAAENAELDVFHGSAGRMLRNRHYIGDDYYPPIVEQELFGKAEEIRIAKADSLGRIRELKQEPKPTAKTSFFMKQATERLSNPFEQAEYLYSLIESEVAEIG